jgi:putative intracellular protease/amidase
MARKKKILVVASNYGVWNEELQAPWDILTAVGHELTIATPQGKKPLPLAASVDPEFVDPVQQYKVNTPEACARMKALLATDVWDHPLKLADARMADYDAIVGVGGLGADLDLANNSALHRLLLEGWHTGKLLCCICFSVAALVFARDPERGFKSLIYGRRMTAHPRAWEFKTNVTYELYGAEPDNHGTDVMTPGFLLPLQDLAIDAVGPGGRVFSDPHTSRENPCVIYDHPFITGCSVESSILYGREIARVLETM